MKRDSLSAITLPSRATDNAGNSFSSPKVLFLCAYLVRHFRILNLDKMYENLICQSDPLITVSSFAQTIYLEGNHFLYLFKEMTLAHMVGIDPMTQCYAECMIFSLAL